MIINQPAKEISFRFQQLRDKDKENIYGFINSLRENDEFELRVDGTEYVIVSDNLGCLCEVYNKCFASFTQKNLKFDVIFRCRWDIDIEKEEAIGYLDDFLNKPTDDGDYTCVEISFVYRKEDTFFLVTISISGEHQITIEMLDSVETDDSIITKYEDAVIAMHKIMKY